MLQTGKEILTFGLVGLAFLLVAAAPVWAGVALLIAFKLSKSWSPEWGEGLEVLVFWGALLSIVGIYTGLL